MIDNILKNNKKGFTLVEILIAVSIFTLITMVVSGIYLAFSRAQTNTKASLTLLNDAQYTLEVMSREIRNSSLIFPTIDDTACNSLIDPVDQDFDNCIFLERESGQTIVFARYTSLTDADDRRLYYLVLDCDEQYSSCEVWDDNPLNYTIFLSRDTNKVEVEELAFIISPDTNPYIEGGTNQQPRVTIQLKVKSTGERAIERVVHLLQTTVSSRIYRR